MRTARAARGHDQTHRWSTASGTVRAAGFPKPIRVSTPSRSLQAFPAPDRVAGPNLRATFPPTPRTRPRSSTPYPPPTSGVRSRRPTAASAADGGLAGLAEDDASLAEAAGAREVDAQAPLERRAAVLAEAVARHPLNREVLYRILSYCFEERPLGDIEREVASWPEFKGATQNPCHMVSTLVRFGGLVAIERDEAGLLVAPERKEGLSEDEADDLVWEVSYLATDAGRRVVEEHSPAGRMQGLFAGAGERAGAYADVLAFVADAPRSYPEIASFLRGRPELETVTTACAKPCSRACSWTSSSAQALWFGRRNGN